MESLLQMKRYCCAAFRYPALQHPIGGKRLLRQLDQTLP